MASTMAEIVYGTKEEGHVMSDKVSQLAASVYSEFEKMIKKYDEDVVKELMPLVVGILESLDIAYTEKQEAEVDMELLREDNEQLLTQYEREKQLRKAADQKYLEAEDETEEYRKEMEDKVEFLESQTRMFELKIKNASDHATRMEDKEVELKKEYNKVHERYTELMRTHMDYMERAKMLMGTDRIADMANSPRSRGGFQLPNLKPVNMISMTGSTPLNSTGSPPDASAFDMMSPKSGKDSNVSLKSELSDLESPDINSNHGRQVHVTTKTSDKEQNTDRVDVREFATATKTSDGSKETPVESPVSEENKPGEKSEGQSAAVTEIESKPKESSSIEPRTDFVLDTDNKQKEVKDSSVEVVRTVDGSESVVDKPEMISENKNSDITRNADRIEKVIGEDYENRVIANSKSIDSSKSDSTVGASKTEEPAMKLNTKLTVKRKSSRKSSKLIPESPTSPLYDEGDFGFEEDPIPGLDDTIAHIVATTPELDDMEESMESSTSNNTSSKRNNASIFDELTIQDADIIGDVDFGADITGRAVNPADYASSDSEDEKEERNSNVSDNFFGMSRELENLILENTELLATKNALNIVKDDLIAKVDELTSEQDLLKEEITTLKGQKTKLQDRIKELEDEVKKTKEDLEKKVTAAQEAENEDDVPMAQRKRFTRVEMARVLMERNQYKERLMELQEAVRWTEMIRASREHPEIAPSKKKSSIWNFSLSSFSNLFNSPNKPSKKPLPVAMVKYNAPTTNVQPVGDPNQKQRSKYNLGDKSKAYDFLQDDLRRSLGEPIVTQPDTSEKAKKEREKERKEQYKQVRAHVKKDDGRMQAYGWSLPAKFQPQLPAASPRNSVPVPVPVYCRPLLETDIALKIWCAAGVNLTGGKTKDGGSIVGASVFYSNPPDTESPAANGTATEVDRLDKELKDHENNVKQTEKEQLSSFVWICTSTHNHSRASVIDANNPGDVLETFRVSTTPILCIASVPGALESDYPVDEDILKAESYPQYPEQKADVNKEKDGGEDSGIGGITLVQCATGGTGASKPGSPMASPPRSRDVSPSRSNITEAVSEALSKQDSVSDHSGSSASLNEARFSQGSIQSLDTKGSQDSLAMKRVSQGSLQSLEKGEVTQPTVFKARGSPATSGTATPEMSGAIASRRLLKEPSEIVKDGINALASGSNLQNEEVEKSSSVLPTMWMGAQSGSLYVHSSVSQWRKCLHSVKLRDSILNIVHVKGRVLAALANGTVAIFHRDKDGQWDLQNYHLLDLGKPHHSIRCMSVIANKHVWCGYKNKIHVVDPKSMLIEKSFDAHPRKESQVRQLAWVGDGVWVSIRLDSTLRLYHAYTHQHLQDVDIEPYVSKMLGTGKLGFSFVRITSMLISCNRLWIGTGNGVIISVPLSEANKQAVQMGSSQVGRPGGLVRVYSDSKTDSITPGSFIPYCTMAQAQLSFHGHKDAVKFFISVPGKSRKGMSSAGDAGRDDEADPRTRLVISGGEGYVDFRIGDGDDDTALLGEDEEEEKEEKASLSKGEKSHLIVWEVSSPDS